MPPDSSHSPPLRQWLHQQWQRWRGQSPGSAPAAALDDATRQRLAALPLPATAATAHSLLEQPLVVFDLETSGLNIHKDVVLAAGAVRIEQQSIVMGKPLECILRVEVPLHAESQLIHGLTQADLARGQEPHLALLELLEFGPDAIWLAYHAAFDHAMLQRAAAHWLGLDGARIPRPLDLAYLAPMLFPQHAKPQAGLDHWLQCFALDMPARHHAAADAFATAQIALIVLAQARQQGLHTWAQLADALAAWQRERAQKEQRDQQQVF
ncbi:DNA polymerase-3 subunit epsilon [Lampropedia hyalina DSM 16112]|uniref:DNA polymerase-3 subunit epsilon n=1 Tax=Lampropedia hyalina DSM 16112 TaxID=1122156 RepID=A0A1M5B518_9BURK|nr:3'-5' exonuclease [Lampropedia hyalina]SHF37506.1 DNA polymerase-3 subunit epsilon [Lampropedia hyalina DSM 16112]